MPAAEPEIGEKLGLVDRLQCLHGLRLYNHAFGHKQIQAVTAIQSLPLVNDRNGHFGLESNPA